MKWIIVDWFKKEGVKELKGKVERFMIRRLIDKLGKRWAIYRNIKLIVENEG